MLWLIVFWDLPFDSGIATSTIGDGDDHAGTGGDDDAFIDRHIDGVDADGVGNDCQAGSSDRRGHRIGVIDGSRCRSSHDNTDLGNPANRRCKISRRSDFVGVNRTCDILCRVVQGIDALNAVLLGRQDIV